MIALIDLGLCLASFIIPTEAGVMGWSVPVHYSWLHILASLSEGHIIKWVCRDKAIYIYSRCMRDDRVAINIMFICVNNRLFMNGVVKILT